jgi:eukaryotic-like serine/threonine-protein kinase
MSLCINPNCQKTNDSDQNLFCRYCGSELLINGRYRIMKLLSDKGGFGNTYEAVDLHNQPRVVKILTNNHPKALELFSKEADVLTKLNHPGIPKGEGELTYFPRDGNTPLHCLVMEKIEGMDLEEYQKQRDNKPIDQGLAIEWLLQLANILDEVHSHNFFHRDIKPSNIILRGNGQLALIDFGAVRQVTATILGGGQNTGIYTPGYAPPEQEKGYAVQQSDFFALGRTFVYLLTGKTPTNPDIYDHYNNELNWEKHAPDLMPNLANYINYLMEEKANKRPPNSASLLKDITEINDQFHSPHRYENSNKFQQIPQTVVKQNKGYIVQYAGFWQRFGAAIIDNVFVTFLAIILASIIALFFLMTGDLFDMEEVFTVGVFGGMGANVFGLFVGVIMGLLIMVTPEDYNHTDPDTLYVVGLFVGIIFKWLYYTYFESSQKQGTFGKVMMGLAITDHKGDRLSFRSANIRYWSKIFSALIACFGYFCVAWTEKKQALHDFIAKSVVIQK